MLVMGQVKNKRLQDKFRRVIDTELRLGVLLWNWNHMVYCEAMLDWCLRQNLTGPKLFAWLQENFKPTAVLQPSQYIISQILKENEARPMVLGKHFFEKGQV